MKNKKTTQHEEWIGRKSSLSYLCAWGCLAKVNMPINKKCKLGLKAMDCMFLGYAHHSIAYRFVVVSSKVPDVHINSLMESRDVTFFENIFPMKDTHGMSILASDMFTETTPEHVVFPDNAEKTPERFMTRLTVKLLDGSRDKGL